MTGTVEEMSRKTYLDNIARASVFFHSSVKYLQHNPGSLTKADVEYLQRRLEQINTNFKFLSITVHDAVHDDTAGGNDHEPEHPERSGG